MLKQDHFPPLPEKPIIGLHEDEFHPDDVHNALLYLAVGSKKLLEKHKNSSELTHHTRIVLEEIARLAAADFMQKEKEEEDELPPAHPSHTMQPLDSKVQYCTVCHLNTLDDRICKPCDP